MITKYECTGCAACANVCAHDAIHMEITKGFFRPHVNAERCVHCGRCSSVCSQNGSETEIRTAKVYAGFAKDLDKRLSGSSGGMFGILSEYLITQKNAVVASVAYDENMGTVFCLAETVAELDKFKKSKYVQANPNNIYRKVLGLLKSQRVVLFAGMPCQVAAVKQVCRDFCDNLYCIDYICHGAPSPEIWQRIVADTEQKHGSKLVHVDFRHKTGKNWDWNHYAICFCFENGTVEEINADDYAYFRAFLANYTLQNACFTCKYKADHTCADITLGDFWEIERTMPEFAQRSHSDHGVSAIAVRSAKGETLIEAVRNEIELEPSDAEKLISGNPCYSSATCPPNNKERYFRWLLQSKPGKMSSNLSRLLKYVEIRHKFGSYLRRCIRYVRG